MSLRRNVAGAAGTSRVLPRCLQEEVYCAYMYDNDCNQDGLRPSGAGFVGAPGLGTYVLSSFLLA